VELNGKTEKVHVKNTGRCRELLSGPGVKVFLSDEGDKERKTRYDLVAVDKQGRLINMDSQAPNAVVKEWLQGEVFSEKIEEVKPEYTYGDSRFDFLVKGKDRDAFIEVKGVTLEQDNVVSFPDAPSERAVKHVEELIRAHRAGYETYVLFVIQMENVDYFIPNEVTHPAFADALRRAAREGVNIVAYDTRVTPDSMIMGEPVKVYLHYHPLYHRIADPLLAWYDRGHRSLPWREDPQPYKVWISEIMLQQTRVEAVKPYFARFMNELPDIASLSSVEDERLLKLWEGLGYYNRARNLKKAAIQIMEEYGGQMPRTREKLMKLAGIGSYTAGAIASIAFGEAVPAVDGNVLRILSRLTMEEEDITRDSLKEEIGLRLSEIMPTDRPGDMNQAMMELGAMVCLPKGKPKCEECPWEGFCLAHQAGREEEYPKKAAAKARTIEKKTILIIQDDHRSALHKRPDKGLLAGMYEFPSLEGHQSAKNVLAYLREMGLEALRIQKLEPARHVFTHKEWHMEAYVIHVDELAPKTPRGEGEEWIFVDAREAEKNYPLPSAFAPYASYLQIPQGSSKLKKTSAKEHEKK
jgi:A/G-specific adenine glycosylase/sugar fermentation stimulation protein